MTRDRMLLYLCLAISIISLVVGSVALSRDHRDIIIDRRSKSGKVNGLKSNTHANEEVQDDGQDYAEYVLRGKTCYEIWDGETRAWSKRVQLSDCYVAHAMKVDSNTNDLKIVSTKYLGGGARKMKSVA